MRLLFTYSKVFILYSCVLGCICGQGVVANEVVEMNSTVEGILAPVGGVVFFIIYYEFYTCITVYICVCFRGSLRCTEWEMGISEMRV